MKSLVLRRAAIIALVSAVAMLPIAAGALYVLQKYTWGKERLAQIAPGMRVFGTRDATNRAPRGSQEGLRVACAICLSRYDGRDSNGQYGSAKVRDLLTSAGLQVISSQVLPLKKTRALTECHWSCALRVSFGLQSALSVLSSQQPVIVINELDVQVLGGLQTLTPNCLRGYPLNSH